IPRQQPSRLPSRRTRRRDSCRARHHHRRRRPRPSVVPAGARMMRGVPAPNIDIVIDSLDPERLAEFWAEALHYDKVGFFDPYFVLLARVPEHPPVALQRVAEAKSGKTRVHFDLRVDDVETEAKRLETLRAPRTHIG